MPLGRDKGSQLAMALNITIQQFTKHTPMTIHEIVDAMAFVIGNAISQKQAIASLSHGVTLKKLRESVIAEIDRGIDVGTTGNSRPDIFIAPKSKLLS